MFSTWGKYQWGRLFYYGILRDPPAAYYEPKFCEPDIFRLKITKLGYIIIFKNPSPAGRFTIKIRKVNN